MPQSYLIFDFGANEQGAQQARHRIETWKQAFRLGKKILWKFERQSPQEPDGPGRIRLLVRLDFSDHEKLSHQRWLDRIPLEAPFAGVQQQVIRPGETSFAPTAEHFDSLD